MAVGQEQTLKMDKPKAIVKNCEKVAKIADRNSPPPLPPLPDHCMTTATILATTT